MPKVRQSFTPARFGAFRVTGPCPTCNKRRIIYVGGSETYVDYRITHGGYECDQCLDAMPDDEAREAARA